MSTLRSPVRTRGAWLLAIGLAVATLTACPKDENPYPDVTDAAIDASPEVDGSACVGPEGCFSCEPEQTEEFLNACTDGSCFGFDNVARLPRYNNGNLPPLP